MKNSKIGKKLLASVLSLALVVSMFPNMSSLNLAKAESSDTNNTAITTEATTEQTQGINTVNENSNETEVLSEEAQTAEQATNTLDQATEVAVDVYKGNITIAFTKGTGGDASTLQDGDKYTVTGTDAVGEPVKTDITWAGSAWSNGVTISGGVETNTAHIITVQGDDQVNLSSAPLNVTLSGVDTKLASEEEAPMAITNSANVNLILSGTNTLQATSNSDEAGLKVSDGDMMETKLEISGDGTLNATGDGIGDGIDGTGSDITIASGTVNATAGSASSGDTLSAGIEASNLTISGGTVNAEGKTGTTSAGIVAATTATINGNNTIVNTIGTTYGICSGAIGTLTIKDKPIITSTAANLTDVAKLTKSTAGIIYGTLGTPVPANSTMTINQKLASDGTTYSTFILPQNTRQFITTGEATLTKGTDYNLSSGGKMLQYGDGSTTFTANLSNAAIDKATYTGIKEFTVPSELPIDLTDGSVDVDWDTNNTCWKITQTGTTTTGYLAATGELTIKDTATDAIDKTISVSGTDSTTNTLNVILSNVNIASTKVAPMAITNGAKVSVTLADKSVNTLNASGATGKAGLEVQDGSTLTIGVDDKTTGTLNATGGTGAAGIGGDDASATTPHSDSIININSGTINAQGGIQAAGIGGAKEQTGGAININGGTVNATGGKSSIVQENSGTVAAIGNGVDGTGCTLTIKEGAIVTTAGSDVTNVANLVEGSTPIIYGTMKDAVAADMKVTQTPEGAEAGRDFTLPAGTTQFIMTAKDVTPCTLVTEDGMLQYGKLETSSTKFTPKDATSAIDKTTYTNIQQFASVSTLTADVTNGNVSVKWNANKGCWDVSHNVQGITISSALAATGTLEIKGSTDVNTITVDGTNSGTNTLNVNLNGVVINLNDQAKQSPMLIESANVVINLMPDTTNTLNAKANNTVALAVNTAKDATNNSNVEIKGTGILNAIGADTSRGIYATGDNTVTIDGAAAVNAIGGTAIEGKTTIGGTATVTATGTNTAGIDGTLTINPTTTEGKTYIPTVRAYAPETGKAVTAKIAKTNINYIAQDLDIAVENATTLTPTYNGAASTDAKFILPAGTKSYFGTMNNAAAGTATSNYKLNNGKEDIYTTDTSTNLLKTETQGKIIAQAPNYTAVQMGAPATTAVDKLDTSIINGKVSVVASKLADDTPCWKVRYSNDGTTYTTAYLKDGGELNIAGTTENITGNTISIDGKNTNALKVNLTNVNIESTLAAPMAITDGAEVALTLAGTNNLDAKAKALKAGLNVAEGTELTIAGEGTLNATGGALAAGIGANSGETSGNITITSGTVNATGGNLGGAGIGNNATSGDITITGNSTVTATGNGEEAPGIGGATLEISSTTADDKTYTPTVRAYAAQDSNAVTAQIKGNANYIAQNLDTAVDGAFALNSTYTNSTSTTKDTGFVLPAGTKSYFGTTSNAATGGTNDYYTLAYSDSVKIYNMDTATTKLKADTAKEAGVALTYVNVLVGDPGSTASTINDDYINNGNVTVTWNTKTENWKVTYKTNSANPYYTTKYLTKDGTLTVKGTPDTSTGNTITVDGTGSTTNTLKLTLSGVNIQSTSAAPMAITDANVQLFLDNTNKLDASNAAGKSGLTIEQKGNTNTLTINGSGKLEAIAGNGASGIDGTNSDNSKNVPMIISSATVTATGGNSTNDGAVISGIDTAALTIDGATVNAIGGEVTGKTSSSIGIRAFGDVTIKGNTSKVDAIGKDATGATSYSSGIAATGNISVTDAKVNAASGKATKNSTGIAATSNVTVAGSATVDAIAKDAGVTSTGIDANALNITGGTVNAKGSDATVQSYGINATGDVTVAGSATVDAIAKDAGATSSGISANALNITGGTVNAKGSDATVQSYGINATGDVTVAGSATVTAAAGKVTAVETYISAGIKATNLTTTGTPTIRAYSTEDNNAVKATNIKSTDGGANYLAGNINTAVDGLTTLTTAYTGDTTTTEANFVLPAGTKSYFGTTQKSATGGDNPSYYTLTYSKNEDIKIYDKGIKSTNLSAASITTDPITLTYSSVQFGEPADPGITVDNVNINNGNVTVKWGADNNWEITYKENSTDTYTTTAYLKAGCPLTINGDSSTPTANTISIDGTGATKAIRVTLNGVDIESTSVAPMTITNADATLDLMGNNTLNASNAAATSDGLKVAGSTLTISGEGILNAIGSTDGMGIDGTGSTVVISGGTINAIAGGKMGGKTGLAAENLIISNGTVNAIGGDGSTVDSIGVRATDLSISGNAVVNATGNNAIGKLAMSAGIASNNINISGNAAVNATSGKATNSAGIFATNAGSLKITGTPSITTKGDTLTNVKKLADGSSAIIYGAMAVPTTEDMTVAQKAEGADYTSFTLPTGTTEFITTGTKGTEYTLDANGGRLQHGDKNETAFTAHESIVNISTTQYKDIRLAAPAAGKTYTIGTALASNKTMDINGASKDNEANVQLYTANGTNAQAFVLEYNGDSTYTIKNVNSGLVLDVAGAGQKNGTNVWQYAANGSDAQKWTIEATKDGYYTVKSVCNDLYLDVNAASTEDGTNIQVYEGNGSDAQKFAFNSVSEQPIASGTYTIHSSTKEKQVMDIANGSTENGAMLQLYESNGTAAQQFELEYMGSGIYTIKAQCSGKAIDVPGASTTSTQLQQYDPNGSAAQQWYLLPTGDKDGSFYVVSMCSGMYMDLANGSTDNTTAVQTYTSNGTQAQKFIFEEVA